MILAAVRLSVFLLCTEMLLSFCPKESYEKYFRVLIHLMLLLLFLLPVKEFLTSGTERDWYAEMEAFQKKLEMQMYKQCVDNYEENVWNGMAIEQGQQEVSETEDAIEIVVIPIEIKGVEIGK